MGVSEPTSAESVKPPAPEANEMSESTHGQGSSSGHAPGSASPESASAKADAEKNTTEPSNAGRPDTASSASAEQSSDHRGADDHRAADNLGGDGTGARNPRSEADNSQAETAPKPAAADAQPQPDDDANADLKQQEQQQEQLRQALGDDDPDQLMEQALAEQAAAANSTRLSASPGQSVPQAGVSPSTSPTGQDQAHAAAPARTSAQPQNAQASQSEHEANFAPGGGVGKKPASASKANTHTSAAASANSGPNHGAARQGQAGTNQSSDIHHDMRRGRISAIRGDDVFVEIMGEPKYQGLAPLAQFDRQPRLRSVMEFVVDQIDQQQGLMFLSREGAVSRATWAQLTRGAVIEARCISTNKGGLELEMIGGIRAFMPASQISLGHIDNLESMVGQKLNAQVQEIDRKTKKVLLSRRAHLEHERERARQKLFNELAQGQQLEGKVSKVVQFGAFVDLGGFDGLVHVTDLSWQHVDKPSDVVQQGQAVKVEVLKIDHEKQQIGLGMKQIQPDPWELALQTTKVGDMVEGKVVNIRPFGAFVELRPGVEALLPTAEMSWSHIAKPEQVVQKGDSLRLAVISIEPEKRRMTLSIKAAGSDPWIGAERKYEVNTKHQGTVQSTTAFGAFIELEAGVEGLAHISELAEGRVGKVEDVVQPGNQVEVRIKDVDEDNRKIGLSLRGEPSEAAAASQAQGQSKSKPKGPARKKQRNKDLKSGLGNIDDRTGGMGLGSLSLDDFK